MAKSSSAQAQLFEAKADLMNAGMDLNTDRNLAWGQISGSSRGLRYEHGSENGAGVYTAPGYTVAYAFGDSKTFGGSLESSKVKHALWIKNDTKIWYTDDPTLQTMYDSGLTLTAGIPQGFLEGPDGDIFTSNQTDAGVRIAVGILKTAAVTADVTINVGTVYINKFTASGTVLINGVIVTYSALDTNAGNLTGVTGIPVAGFPIDSLVIQTSTPTNFNKKGYIMVALESHLLMFGVKDNEAIGYYSAIYGTDHPEYFYDFTDTAHGAGYFAFSNSVKAAIEGLASAYAMLERGIIKLLGFDTTSGALLTQVIDNEYGAYNQNCVVNMDGMVAFWGQKRLIPITLTLTPLGSVAPMLNPKFDHNLRPWLLSHDDITQQANACLKWDSTQKLLKISACINGANQTYAYDAQTGGFLPIENRQVATSIMFLGQSYFGHTDNGNLYLDDTSSTDDGVPIPHIISTGRVECDKGRRYLKSYIFRYEGWLSQDTVHTLRVYINGASDPAMEVDYAAEDLIISQSGRPIGLRGMGISQPGGSTDPSAMAYPFVNTVLLRGLNGEDFRFEWDLTGEGYFMQLNTWYFSAYVPRKQPRTAN